MKVDISHGEKKKGLVFSKPIYGVSCSVTFTEEEQQIIKQHKLKDRIIQERRLSADLNEKKYYDREEKFYLRIKTLMKGPDVYYTWAPSDAKVYEAELIENLRELKHFLDGNAELGETKSFEL